MKETYMTPEMAVLEYNTEILMQSVSVGNTLPGVGDGGDGTGKDEDTRGHRGSWGDLWN